MNKTYAKSAIAALLISISSTVFSQSGNVSINLSGAPSANPTAILDLSDASNNQTGLLLPNVSLTASNSILPFTTTPATGLIVWNTNAAMTSGFGVGFYFYDGTQWDYLNNTGTVGGSYINNGTTSQAGANFNIGQNGIIGGSLTVGGQSNFGDDITIGASGNPGELLLNDNTSNTIAIKAPNAVTTYTMTLPAAVASANGQVLTSTTAGVLSWTTASGGVSSITGTAPINITPTFGAPVVSLQGTNGGVFYGTGAGSTLTATGAQGSMLYNATASTPSWLTVGTTNQILTSNGTIPVWGSLPSGSITADNGVNINTANNVELGGSLTKNTTINQAGNSLSISGGTISLNNSSGNSTNINTGTSNGTVTIGGSSSQTISIGSGGSTKTVTLGSSTNASSTALLSGSGGISLNLNNGQPTNINTGSSTGTVSIGGIASTPVNINNAGNGVTTIGNSTGHTFFPELSTSGIVTNLATGQIGTVSTVPVANGGTGLGTTPANGQIDIGNGVGFTRSTLTAGTGITITNAAGSITIAATGGGSGTVTSFSSGNLSPLFTTSVTSATTTPALSFTLSNAAAYSILGNNTNASAAPSYFTPILASALFENQGAVHTLLHGNAAGNPSWSAVDVTTDITGIVPIANGGTGSSSQNWVDLTTGQTAAGAKTWSGAASFTNAGTGLAVTNNATIGGTFAVTGTSALTGATTIGKASTTTGSLIYANSTNANTVTINSGVTSTSYSLVLPTAQGSANSFLTNDGSGNLSWRKVTTAASQTAWTSNYSGNTFLSTAVQTVTVTTTSATDKVMIQAVYKGTNTSGSTRTYGLGIKRAATVIDEADLSASSNSDFNVKDVYLDTPGACTFTYTLDLFGASNSNTVNGTTLIVQVIPQ